MNKLHEINIFSATVFVSIYESLNAMSVAKKLNVPASKISRCLSALRHTLDDQLFIRRQYGFEPTPMADKLYPYFQQLLNTTEQIRQVCHPQNAQQEREIIIYAPATLRGCLFTQLQRALAEQGHHFTFCVKPIPDHDPEILLQGSSDLVLAFQPAKSERLLNRFIADGEQLFLIARPGHPLLDTPDEQMLPDCLEHPFLMVECPAFNDRVDPLELYALEEGRPISMAGSVGGLAEAADYVRQSDAFTFVASQCAASFFEEFPGVQSRRFSQVNFDRLHRRSGVPRYYAIQRKDRPVPTALLETVCSLIKGCVVLPDAPAFSELSPECGCTAAD